jgi:hypothetical protein
MATSLVGMHVFAILRKKQAKQRFYDNINEHLDDLKTVNSKMYWKTIHMLLKNDRSTNALLPLFSLYENPSFIIVSAEYFTFFLNLFVTPL